MKKIFSIIALLAFAGSVYAGCPSKPIHGKVVGFDKESKTLTVAQGKKEKKIQVGSKTEMVGVDCPTKLAKGARVLIDGCNCKNKTASKIALSKGKGKKKEKKG
ncbi:MAG: hypothetical protein HN548_08830 [Opitutae bacterium]|nr:hypothetical protein [Opitutae bacterium]